jgi:hypothetical protein
MLLGLAWVSLSIGLALAIGLVIRLRDDQREPDERGIDED